MKLEILGARVEIRPVGHNTNPDIVFLRDLDLKLGEIRLKFGFNKATKHFKGDGDSFIIEWKMTGGAKICKLDKQNFENKVEHQFYNYRELPEITHINKVFYEAYVGEEELDFELISLSLNVIDYNQKELSDIIASQDVIDSCNKSRHMIYEVDPDVKFNLMNMEDIEMAFIFEKDISCIIGKCEFTSDKILLNLNNESCDIEDLTIDFVKIPKVGVVNEYIPLDSVELINVNMTKEEFKRQCEKIFMREMIKKARTYYL